MSMKENYIHDFGLVLDFSGVKELLDFYNNEKEKREIDDYLYCESLNDIVFEYDIFSCFYSLNEVSGTIIQLCTDKKKDFIDMDFIILPLKKIGLYVKYDSLDDIYEEIKETLVIKGFDVTLDFIKKYTREIYGSFWG